MDRHLGVWEAQPVVITHQCEMLHRPFLLCEITTYSTLNQVVFVEMHLFLGWLKREMDPSVMTRPHTTVD